MANKRLTITYGDAVLYDDSPETVQWSEANGRIRVEAGTPAVNPLMGPVSQAIRTAMENKRTAGAPAVTRGRINGDAATGTT